MRRPEILAPAGDRDALAAALAAGADAVYFGLDDGFNARARAENFPSHGLAEVVAWVHRAGARVYVTLNTLVFEGELATVEELIRRVAAAGVDAIIVQDPAVVLLARATCPELEVHASTQMTASSPLAVELLKQLGLRRVVVPRELSVDEIRAYRDGTGVELEVFVHGALCVAWSGQCLSSEAWGGRSANRGQCAQACRLPYQLVVDGETRELGEVAYLLSPKDLVGLDAVPALAEVGVTSLKIEGRLKGPAYVATAVAQYRHAVDPAFEPAVDVPLDRASLEIAYSRGVSHGFLGGVDHQTLVEGRFPRHRGLALGRVTLIEGDELEVVPDPAQRPITGGARGSTPGPDAVARDRVDVIARVWASCSMPGRRSCPSKAVRSSPRPGPRPDTGCGSAIRDPIYRRCTSATSSGSARIRASRAPARGRPRPDAACSAGSRSTSRCPGPPDVRSSSARPSARGHAATGQSTSVLAPARGAGITRELCADKLGSFGGTAFRLGTLDASKLPTALHLPVSELKEIRRALVAELDAAVGRVDRTIAAARR